MEDKVLNVFMGEVARQSAYVIRATRGINEGLSQHDTEGVWHSIQALLTAAGTISMLLWPEARFAERGADLRSKLAVRADSPLADRTLRNHFIHFDERLERWAAKMPGVIVDSNISEGPIQNFVRSRARNQVISATSTQGP